jgi:hypothetical protein
MAIGDNKPAETAPIVEQQPQTPPEKPKTPEQAPNPTEVAERQLDTMRKKFETERLSLKQRDESIQQAAQAKRDKESWVNNKMDPPNSLLEGTIRDTISSNVEEEIQPYLPMLQQNGLGESANLIVVKQTAKDIIFEHYCKTGKNEDITKEYAKNTLLPKFKSLTENVQRIFLEKKTLFPNPLAVIESFSSFSKLDFCAMGILDAGKFKEFALLDAATQDFQIKTFEQHLKNQAELATLSGQETNLALSEKKPETGKIGTEKPSEAKPEQSAAEKPAEAKTGVAALFENGTLKLTSKVRFIIPANPAEMGPKLKTAIIAALPGNLENANKEAIANNLITAIERTTTPPPQAGETFEIAENGRWQKIDVQTEKAQVEAAKKQAEKVVAAAGVVPESMVSGIKGFFEKHGILATIIGFIFSLFGIKGFEQFFGGESAEFAGLSAAEKEEANKMKEAMGKIGLNMETLHKLFVNTDGTKKILKLKEEKKLPWDKFLEKYLDPSETTILKDKQDLKPDAISAMLLSPKEQTGAAMAATPAAAPTEAKPAEAAPTAPAEATPPATAAAEQPASAAEPEQTPETPA